MEEAKVMTFKAPGGLYAKSLQVDGGKCEPDYIVWFLHSDLEGEAKWIREARESITLPSSSSADAQILMERELDSEKSIVLRFSWAPYADLNGRRHSRCEVMLLGCEEAAAIHSGKLNIRVDAENKLFEITVEKGDGLPKAKSEMVGGKMVRIWTKAECDISFLKVGTAVVELENKSKPVKRPEVTQTRMAGNHHVELKVLLLMCVCVIGVGGCVLCRAMEENASLTEERNDLKEECDNLTTETNKLTMVITDFTTETNKLTMVITGLTTVTNNLTTVTNNLTNKCSKLERGNGQWYRISRYLKTNHSSIFEKLKKEYPCILDPNKENDQNSRANGEESSPEG